MEFWLNNDYDENDLFSDEEVNYSNMKSGIIFIVDCTESMFKKRSLDSVEKVPLFNLALDVIHQYCLHHAFYTNRKELISVVLIGTGAHQNSGDFSCIYQLNELENVSYGLLNTLNEFKLLEENSFGLKFNGFSRDFTFSNIIWTLLTIFTQRKNIEFNEKKVYILSNECELGLSVNSFNQSLMKYKDLTNSKVELFLVPIGQNNCHIESNEHLAAKLPKHDAINFKDKLIYRIIGEKYIFPAILFSSECEMNAHVLCKEGRVVSKIPMFLDSQDSDFLDMTNYFSSSKKIYVNLHLSVKESNPPPFRKVDKVSNEEVSSIIYAADSSNKPIMSDDYLYRLINGKPNVLFTKDDLQALRVLSYPPEVRQLSSGFIQIKGFINHLDSEIVYIARDNSYFVSCSNQNTNDEFQIFSSLIKCCKKLNKYAVCLFAPNFKSRAFYGLLCPYSDHSDATFSLSSSSSSPNVYSNSIGTSNIGNPNNQKIGFYLKKLPFLGEYRDYLMNTSENKIPESHDSQLNEEMLNLVDASLFTQMPQISNPSLQKMHSFVEAIALEKEEPRKFKDSLSMPVEMKNRTEPIVHRINNLLSD